MRVMFVGGGSTPSLLGPLGSLPMPLVANTFLPNGWATVVDWLLRYVGGFSGGLPSAVTGALPT